MKNKIYNVYILTEDIPWVGYTGNIYDRMCNHKSKGNIRNLKSYKVLYTTTNASEARKVERSYHDKGYLGKHIGGEIQGKKAVESGLLKRLSDAQRTPILQYTKSGEFIKEFVSQREAGKELNINHGNINKVLKGIGTTCGGFVFRYKEELTC